MELEKRTKKAGIGKFETGASNGSLAMAIRAHKPESFGKPVQKVRNDVGIVTIKNAA